MELKGLMVFLWFLRSCLENLACRLCGLGNCGNERPKRF
ncbi:hypothetical protein E2C01_074375 [Portunus trituberculatus]|uniref:Uncharacterized protein n=1 Tax=Portunus trituberculatus TaxID=210409 RepID=A0A5B7IG57_PORTR|nr:hypothetical protein [Portunus trituberculatus]